ncbi:MAG: AAA family ATPase, partial [Desulfobulbaceae bacterium]|nr:AAA family ATPase [Desulfobulbaceae bacterium]
MKLLSLVLTNFKGVKSFTFSPAGNNASVLGDNGTGKTSLADSISWLLFDKDSKGNSKFDIKTQGADGQPIHNLEHTVEGVFDTLTLKKTYREIWTKKRGSNAAEFSGHTTDYEIDGVPVQKKEYQARVAAIAPEEMFRLLTTPNYFPEIMSWQQRRSILMEVCGDVADADVVAGSKELQPLDEIMATRKLDDHKKVVSASMTKINAEIKLLPARIDEASRSIPAEDIDVVMAEKLIAGLQEKKAAADSEYARAEVGQDGDQKKEIAEIDARLLAIETEANREKQAAIDAVEQDARKARNALRDIEDQILRDQKALDVLRGANVGASVDEHVAGLNAQMDYLREEWARVDSLAYTVGDCPTCGQLMPV